MPYCSEGKIRGSYTYHPSLSSDKGGKVMWLQTGAYGLTSLYWLIAVIVIALIALIALIVAGRALARARAEGQPGAPGMGPEDHNLPESFRMLNERYAKGEISREEYMQRQTDLQSKI